MVTLWHGTTSNNLPSIQREGLVYGKAKGGDYWGTKRQMNIIRNHGKRVGSVYASTEKADAMFFSKLATEINGGDPIILKLEIPEETFSHVFVHDEAEGPSPTGKPEMYRTVKDALPPKYIKDVANVKGQVIRDMMTGRDIRI